MEQKKPKKTKKLSSIQEFNIRRLDRHRQLNNNSPRPNGIACPKCGKELLDSSPMMTLISNPPMKNVHCNACGHVGYRYA